MDSKDGWTGVRADRQTEWSICALFYDTVSVNEPNDWMIMLNREEWRGNVHGIFMALSRRMHSENEPLIWKLVFGMQASWIVPALFSFLHFWNLWHFKGMALQEWPSQIPKARHSVLAVLYTRIYTMCLFTLSYFSLLSWILRPLVSQQLTSSLSSYAGFKMPIRNTCRWYSCVKQRSLKFRRCVS